MQISAKMPQNTFWGQGNIHFCCDTSKLMFELQSFVLLNKRLCWDHPFNVRGSTNNANKISIHPTDMQITPCWQMISSLVHFMLGLWFLLGTASCLGSDNLVKKRDHYWYEMKLLFQCMWFRILTRIYSN